MDYPKSDATVGLVGGKFTDGDPAKNIPASRDPAAHMNALTDEVLAVITEAGMTPDETKLTQLRDAIYLLASESGAKQNLTAAVAPTPNDDQNAGYSVGSFWVDTANNAFYRCIDASAGSAVWKELVDETGGDARYAQIGAANAMTGDQVITGNLIATVIRAQKFIDANGFDVADLFEPLQAGDPTATNTGLQDSSQGNKDLSAIYAPLSVGSAIGHNTMLTTTGSAEDLTAIFAAKGSRPGTALSATIPSTRNAVTNAGGGTASTSATCSASGGSGGYTYLWEVVSGSAALANATSATCTVSEAVPGYTSTQSTIKCTVKDSSGTTVSSNNCVVTFKYVSATALSASIPTALNAYTGQSGGTASKNVTCTPSGGTGGGYTYQWLLVSGAATITNATSATCTVTESVPGTGYVQSTIKCVVHDASGASAGSNNCDITFLYQKPGVY